MDIYVQPGLGLPPDSPDEINERLKRRYLDRLGHRVKRLRRLLVERSWEDLRLECSQLALSGETFGFTHLTELAWKTHHSIPSGRIPRAATPSHAKQTAEVLICAIDCILIENFVSRA